MAELGIKEQESPFKRYTEFLPGRGSLLSFLAQGDGQKESGGQEIIYSVQREARVRPARNFQEFPQGSFGQLSSFVQPSRAGDFDLVVLRADEFREMHELKPSSDESLSQHRKSWLAKALDQLRQVDLEAEGEGYPKINELCKRNSEMILAELAKKTHQLPAIYPTPDGEVAILFQRRSAKSSILILCGRDGRAVCFSTISGKKSRVNYDDANELPDSFVKDKLLQLRLAG